jgi:hypothetical protein
MAKLHGYKIRVSQDRCLASTFQQSLRGKDQAHMNVRDLRQLPSD